MFARAISVNPDSSSSGIEPDVPTGSVSVDSDIVPEFDFTYFVTDHVGVELILATSAHDIIGEEAIAGLGKVAKAKALPPTLTVQYHFQPEAQFSPYVGVGVNYTLFYDEKATTSLNNAIGATSVDLDESFGLAAQAGVDVKLNDRWFLNADVKYIQIDTTATLNTSGMINSVNVDVNPVVIGLGVGTLF
ncbi:MAG: OmpW/AlkL family protein [bacterium]